MSNGPGQRRTRRQQRVKTLALCVKKSWPVGESGIAVGRSSGAVVAAFKCSTPESTTRLLAWLVQFQRDGC